MLLSAPDWTTVTHFSLLSAGETSSFLSYGFFLIVGIVVTIYFVLSLFGFFNSLCYLFYCKALCNSFLKSAI